MQNIMSYPVYKAHIVPYWDGEKFADVSEVTKEDIERWQKVLEKMKEFLKKSCEFAKDLSGVQKLEMIGDLITLFFKNPLLREPLEEVIPSALSCYLSWRLMPSQLKEVNMDFVSFAKQIYDGKRIFEGLPILQEVEKIREDIEKCWFTFPADTRPVFNTSSLIVHLITTSALAWALATERRQNFARKDVATIRLASLLHDVGKPFNPKDHVNVSVEETRKLLSGLLDPQEVDEICKIVKDHHIGETPEGKLIREADHLSSAADRLSRLWLKFLGEKIKEKLQISEEKFWNDKEKWEFWEEIHEKDRNIIRELSEEFVRKVREETQMFLKPLPEEQEASSEREAEIKVMRIDFGGIQKFIRTATELRTVGAASFAIDVAVMAHLPAFLQYYLEKMEDVWIPSEAFVYASGGNLLLFLPPRLAEAVTQLLDDFEKNSQEFDVPVRKAAATFKISYSTLLAELEKEMAREKLRVKEEAKVKVLADLCRACYLRAPANGEEMCDVCKALDELGSKFHFKQRWEWLGAKNFFGEWEKMNTYLMQIIAGHNQKEIEEGIGKRNEGGIRERNYAVVKADGNYMGAFFATAISPTDACERSARVDLALKKSFEQSLRELEQVDPEAGTIVKLGLLYMGGDDMLLLCPSWIAPIFAMRMSQRFMNYIGRSRGLSVGVAAGPAKAPVWALLEAADELEREAKARLRNELNNQLKKREGLEVLSFSSICLDIAETTLTNVAVKTRRAELESKRITSQPFLITGNRSKFQMILEKLAGSPAPQDWYGWARKVSRPDSEKDSEEKKFAKKIRQILREAWMKAESLFEKPYEFPELVIEVSKVYLLRQQERLQREDRVWDVIFSILPKEWGEPAPYGDVELVIKMLGGGMI